ncbi:MAG: PKD-like family lipoprotein [Rikenellaceae bacterium]|nr:PKD-like family lipoprotein [Rikenellaceae bacterium]MCL2692286.1 PKD-like family lipoprotein [Rikenellaceae bacterium]
MKKILYITAAFALLCSCVEDKGSTGGKDVNWVDVRLPAEIAAKVEPQTITIAPELSQTLAGIDRNNLEFEWLRSYTNFNVATLRDTEVIGNSETLEIEITGTETHFNQYIRLNVTDRETGMTYAANVLLRLIRPYSGAWMVLHEAADGTARLAAIEYLDVPVVTPDAYYKETGTQFTGAPVSLLSVQGFSYNAFGTGSNHKIFGLVTDNPDESGILVQWDRFRQEQSLRQLIAPSATPTFDLASFSPAVGSGVDWGFTIISGGQLYNCPIGMKIYKAHMGSVGSVDIKYSSKFGFVTLVYDALEHRFLAYLNQANAGFNHAVFNDSADNPTSATLQAIGSQVGNATGADPNALPAAQQVLWLGTGFKHATHLPNFVYGLAVAKAGSTCAVYEFNSRAFAVGGLPRFTEYTELPAPPGLDENSRFASSDVFNGIIFYTSGSTVYRWDYKAAGGPATPIYSNENGGVAVRMTFARNATDTRAALAVPEYEFDPNFSLAVGFNLPDGTGEVAVINLSASGRPGDNSERFSAVQTHSGLGPITDLVFI